MTRALLEEYVLELVYHQSVIAGVLVWSTDEGASSRLSALLDRVNHLLLDVKRRLTLLQRTEASESGYCACHNRVYRHHAPYTLPRVVRFPRRKPTVWNVGVALKTPVAIFLPCVLVDEMHFLNVFLWKYLNKMGSSYKILFCFVGIYAFL